MKVKTQLMINLLILIGSLSYGQSEVGNWSADSAGLPVFEYTGKIPYKVTAKDGVKITYPEDPWFLLGNYNITAFVHTSGIIDLYTLRRAWGRLNTDDKKSPASFAEIKADGKKYLLTGLDSPVARDAKKVFGTGFAEFKMKTDNNLSVERIISAKPSEKINTGIPALLITVKITNTGTVSQQIEYSEAVLAGYQMINEARISYTPVPGTSGKAVTASFEPHTDKIISKPKKDVASTYDFYPPVLFVKGNNKTTYNSTDKNTAIYLKATQNLKIRPGETKTLLFTLGYIYDNENIDKLSEKLFKSGSSDPEFRSLWKKKLPDYSYQKNDVIRREMYWNTYVLEASAKYNTYFDETFIPQGMAYDYLWGLNAVARDHLHYSLPANYFNPELSKSIIRFVMKGMMPTGYFNYNINGYGYSAPNLWSPSDLQLHLLWAVAEYLKVTEDYSFLKEKTAYYPKRIQFEATTLEKITTAFNYLYDEISTGPHGLVRILNSDWNDQIWHNEPLTIYYNTAESHYNSSMAIVVLQDLAEVLKKAENDPKLTADRPAISSLIEKLNIYRNRQLEAFKKDLGNRDFVKRAYYDESLSMGDKKIHIESQLYTLMIDEITLEQRKRIVKQIEKRLTNHEVLGVRTSEVKVFDAFKTGTHENGGIWQYVQGMYALGLLHIDQEKADSVIEKMSFNNFAKQYPEYWPGQWTGMDCVNSSLAKYPGLVSNNGSMYMNFPAYCTHIHSWPLLYQFKRKEAEKQKLER